MNIDKVEELAKKIYGVKVTKNPLGNPMYEFTGTELAMFAELIVRDSIDQIQSCLDCTEQNDDFEYGFYRGLECAKKHIEDHFGVEE